MWRGEIMLWHIVYRKYLNIYNLKNNHWKIVINERTLLPSLYRLFYENVFSLSRKK